MSQPASVEVTMYVLSLDAQPYPQGEHGKAITLINTGLNIKINILGV